MLTNQQIFDKVRKHLLNQMEKSISVDGQCAYRGAKGLMCAIGCLIADEDYDPMIEGKGVKLVPLSRSGEILSISLDKAGVPRKKNIYTLLKDLRRIHDNNIPDKWEILLNNVALEHQLIV